MAYQTSATPGSGYGNPYIDALIWGCQWTNVQNVAAQGTVSQPVIITYSLGFGILPYTSVSSPVWTSNQANAVQAALNCFSNVCNVSFSQLTYTSTYSLQSNLVFYQVPYTYFGSNSILGMFEVPDGTFTSNWGYFNYNNSTWNNLSQGSYGFITLIHELGHALGLAHPHDGGSGDNPTTFPGVPFNNSTSLRGLWP